MSTPRYRRPGPNMTVSTAVLHDPDWLLILQARMWGHFYVVRLMNNYREDKGISQIHLAETFSRHELYSFQYAQNKLLLLPFQLQQI
jgi:hypothetical protein